MTGGAWLAVALERRLIEEQPPPSFNLRLSGQLRIALIQRLDVRPPDCQVIQNVIDLLF